LIYWLTCWLTFSTFLSWHIKININCFTTLHLCAYFSCCIIISSIYKRISTKIIGWMTVRLNQCFRWRLITWTNTWLSMREITGDGNKCFIFIIEFSFKIWSYKWTSNNLLSLSYPWSWVSEKRWKIISFLNIVKVY
jgi:hypothetical protein